MCDDCMCDDYVCGDYMCDDYMCDDYMCDDYMCDDYIHAMSIYICRHIFYIRHMHFTSFKCMCVCLYFVA